jgi:hypothetical protein
MIYVIGQPEKKREIIGYRELISDELLLHHEFVESFAIPIHGIVHHHGSSTYYKLS